MADMEVDEEVGNGSTERLVDDLSEEEISQCVAEETIKAKAMIVEFLTSKGVSAAIADSYLVDCRVSNLGKRQSRLLFTNRFRSEEGLSLPSKYDVLGDAKKKEHLDTKNAASATVFSREEVFEEKKAELASFEGNFPVNIDGFLVHSFGKIKVETSGSPEFHNPVQIYPIGYKVEIEFGCLRSLEATTQYFICEIVEKDGGPEFTITNKSNGQIHWAATESMAFKKLEAISGYANIGVSQQSFFNMGIELLIEGMEGALHCPEYMYHGQRGYGYSYFDQEESQIAKAAALAKDSRERRNRRREALRFMTPEEAKQATALEKKRMAEEKEQEKLNVIAEKARKDKEKKADKARIDASKAAVKAKKDKEKKEAEEVRLKQREEEKAAKEKQKADEKYRSQYRRSVKNEAKKKRSEASMKVLDLFDKLEGGPDSDDEGSRPSTESAGHSALAKAIKVSKSCNEVFLGANTGVEQVEWNHAVEVANSLYLHKDILNLQFPCTLEHLVDNLAAISGGKKKSDAMDVEGDGKATKAKNHHAHISLDNIISKYPRIEAGSKMQAIAELDRTQLCIIKSMTEEIHRMLDIDGASGEGLPEDSRSAARVAFRLPLNQLTWPEIARMCLLCSAFKELRGDNAQTALEAQFAIKGSRANPYRAQKNVVRHIRYLWHTRKKTAVDVKKENLSDSAGGKGSDTIVSKLADRMPEYVHTYARIDPRTVEDSILNNSQYPLAGTFNGEGDVLEALEKVALNDSDYSELYRRMACVLHKILNIPAAKNFLWDLDSDSMEDYFTVIKRPVMLVNIAMHIVNRSYDDVENVTDEKITRDFFLETQSVFTNCYVFNTELQALVGQAQRCSIAFTRHFQLWVVGAEFFPIEKCSMKFCTFSQHLLQTNTWLACGRCAANCDVNQLEKVREQGNPFLIMPTQELQASTLVEWVCPMCLEEDGLRYSRGLKVAWKDGATVRGSHWSDDNGPSSHIPWQFNPALSTEADHGMKDSPSLRLCLEALQILSDPMKTGILSSEDKGYVDAGDDTASEGEGPARDSSSGSGSGGKAPTLWTLNERLVVLLALCNHMRTMGRSMTRVQFLYQECEKLRTIAAQGTFREGDFMRVVKGLCGDEVTATCRAMLDGISGSADAGVQREMKARVFEGRCSVCRVSTYEEDQEDGEEVGEVLLCEGCNAEVHLRCTGFAAIPKDDWYCHECEARNQARGGNGGVMGKFNNLNNFRSVNAEEDIINYKIDRIAAEEGHKVIDNILPVDTTEVRCAYCDMSEIEVGSPIVCGQTRAEHMEYVSRNGRDKCVMRSGTQVHFKLEGKTVPAPQMSLPYFPLLASWDGDDLLEHALSMAVVGKESQLHVHEVCALEMFRARLGTIRHAARRQRVKVADLAICMAGAIIRPLGVDDMGREYWRFPSCRGLFICNGPYGNEDEVAFNTSLKKIRANEHKQNGGGSRGRTIPGADLNTSPKAGENQLWKVVIGNANIRVLASHLGGSRNETQLRRKLRSYFTELEERIVDASASAALAAASASSSSSSSSTLAGDVKPSIAAGAAVAAPAAEPSLSARQQAVVEKVKEEAEAQAAEQKKQGAVDKEPVALELSASRGKGSGIDREVCIQSETVFDEAAPTNKEPDDGSYADFSEYFSFGRKYYGVGLVNAEGKHLKPTKGEFKVTYMVHRAGLVDPLVCDYITDPWTDGYFYFSSCTFKRSGQYTISFLVEGTNATIIEPLVFPVSVRSMMTVCGPKDALGRLEAINYFHGQNRRILSPKLKRSVIETKYYDKDAKDELSSVRACLLAVFIALPAGALAAEITGKDGKVKSRVKEAPRDENITECIGWNEELEELWYEVVTGATSAKELMEAVLCMEYYMQRKWISEYGTKLLNALPPAHYAIRAPTLPAVAMRVYCLDKVILYDKFTTEARAARSSNPRADARGDRGDGGDGVEDIGKVSGRKRTRVNYAEVAGEDVYEDGRQVVKARAAPAPTPVEEDDGDYLPDIDFDDEMADCGRAPYNDANDFKLRCLSILRALYQDENIAFWYPVGDEVEGYKEMVKEPMDLASVLKKVKTARIRDAETFKAKVELVWNNCMFFNGEESMIYQLAQSQKERAERMHHLLFVSEDKPIDPIVTFDEDGTTKKGEDEVGETPAAAPAQVPADVKVKEEEQMQVDEA